MLVVDLTGVKMPALPKFSRSGADVRFPLLLKARMATITPFSILAGSEDSQGILIAGFARFRRAMRDAITLITDLLPDERNRVKSFIATIAQAPVSVYGFQADPGLIFVRFRRDFGPIDWAGTLVHAAVHSEQYRRLRDWHSHEDAIIALCSEELLEEEAGNAELRALAGLGVDGPERYMRSRGTDTHTYFGVSRRKARRHRQGTS